MIWIIAWTVGSVIVLGILQWRYEWRNRAVLNDPAELERQRVERLRKIGIDA